MAFTLPPCRTPTTPWSRTSTRRRWRSITTSTTQAYVNNLNKALEPAPDLQKQIASRSCSRRLDSVPEDIRTAVRNNGGGHANHTMFWEIMGPGGGGEPERRAGRRHHKRVRRLRTRSRSSSPRPAPAASAAAGPGWSRTGGKLGRRQHRQPGQPADGAARRRSWASTSGSTPTTSSTRTGGPTISPPGGTWSTGPRSASRFE